MATKARARIVVAKLWSMAGTGYFYALRRPRANAPLETMKYDPVVRQHVLFTEKRVAPPKP